MKNILLISGGNDSMYIYHKYKNKKFTTIYIDYGQPYFDEERLRIPIKSQIINIPSLTFAFNGFVPGRNLLFLIEIAKRYSEGTIWMGSNKDDIFSDNNKEFLEKAIFVINKSFDTNLKIKLPLKNKTKKEIMDYIIKNKINTYSCYKGGKERCGKCKACLSVINATKDSSTKK